MQLPLGPRFVGRTVRLVFALIFFLAGGIAGSAAPSAFVIEAEDFNYGSGQHVPSASTMPYIGGGYNGLGAVGGVDYFQPAHDPSADEYRLGENPNVPMTQNPDMQRPGWTVNVNYRIGWTAPGDWYNYTRTFPAGVYKVSAALSHDSTAESALKGSLQRVTSSAAVANQTVQQLGVFDAPGSGGWGLNNLAPLRDGAGKLVELSLNGSTTLRFTAESAADIDYFLFEPLLPPEITLQPQSITVVENRPARFFISVASLDAVSFQWLSNGVSIAGATNIEHTLPFAPMSANGARFQCIAHNGVGAVNSAEAILTVTSEQDPPTLVQAYNAGPNTVVVRFSEPVRADTANVAGNYRLSGGASVNSAALNADATSVTLGTSALNYRTSYVLTVSGVRDASGSANLIAPNSTISFVAQQHVAQNIGGAGQTIAAGTGYDVTATGADIGGAGADAFHFGWEQRTGNFDVRARVAGITITDAFMQAGLMARETLNPDSRFAGAFGSSPQLGAFFEARGTAATKATTAAPGLGYPANYPHMWLRLQRSASVFTGFASMDGENWTQLGASTIALPNTIYLGLAVSSGTTNSAARAEFRDLGDVTSGPVVPLQYPRERLGPSSRRTGLAISEIMYHPAARADGKELEFVEIYNGGAIFEDLSGMRLSGAIEYEFPAGTRLEAGAFVVVAKAPADVQAHYSLSGVLGPWTGSLQNEEGSVRLSDERGHLLLDAVYSGGRRWPAAADGGGSSLVLARPSYGEGDVRAWEASTFIGGSPGGTDPVVPAPEANVAINEFLAHTDLPQVDFIELYNHGNVEADVSGFWLSDEAGTNKFRIPDNTRIAPRGYAVFDQTALGFALSSGGEQIFLVNSNGTRVIDALKFGAQENGVSSGRWPDGASTIRRLGSVTKGAANSRWRDNTVVINEIMYAPISGNSDDEYVELHNNTATAISLKDWKLTGGIDFKFPAGASIPAGGFVVVGKDAARLRANYTQLNANNSFGDYSGSLRNSSERLALTMPDQVLSTNEFEQVLTNWIDIEVCEVAYVDGGRWSQWADGGGSSLELIDPRADTTQPDNWRESDETAKAAWSTIETTGVLDNGHGNYNPANQLQVTLQGAGECLIDQVEVIEAGFNYVVTNADFELGTTGWVFQGNHAGSTVDSTGAFQGTRALHIRAPGRGDTGINRIRTALRVDSAGGRTLAVGDTVTIRAKVRWLKGWPEVLLRLRGGWLELGGRMALPSNLGTPGQANSRRVPNAGPAIYDIMHSPAVPAANQPVLVTARYSDPDGFGSLNLRYRIDPSTTVTTATMRDDGAGGDAVAGDGLYTGLISGRASGTTIAFRVEASDPSNATTIYPNDAPTRECLIRWGSEQLRFGTLATYLMWSTSKTATDWNNTDDKNNTYRDVTFVYNSDRVVYNAGVKDKGSPFHSGGGDAFLVMPEDQKVLGATDFAICSTGNGGNEPTAQREILIMWIARKMGANYLNRRSVHFVYNGSSFRGRNIMEDSEEPNGVYAQASVPEGGDGDLYKIEDWFEFDDAASGFVNVDATLQPFTTTGGAYKLARYRWAWRKRAVEDSANNYTNLFDLVSAVNVSGADYVSRVENLVNVRGWMAVFALQRIAGNWDSYGFNRGKNAYIYKGEGVRWEMFPWDIDFVLGNGSNGATDALFGGSEPVINRMFNTLGFRRLLWQAYLEAVTDPLLAANYRPQLDARYRMFVANGVSGIGTTGSIVSYIEARRNKIITDMNAANTAAFAITSNNGNDVSTAAPVFNLAGRAPFAVYTIEVNGAPYPVRWTSAVDWTIAVPLAAQRTTLNVTARDRLGNLLPQFSDTITVTYTGTLHQPEGNVVINEIMYNPAVSAGSFIEIHNRHASASFDLSGWRLDGVGYVFPDGVVIAPNGFLVVAQNLAGFAAAHGPSIAPVGEFPGSLDNGGERLKLVKPGATAEQDVVVDEVRYDDELPWPVLADGFGPSLQLIDPAQDNWPPSNWGVTATNAANRATPAAANAGIGTLPAFPKVVLNEVLANNVAGPADRFNEKEPWIELVNSGTASLDLSGLYLSDNNTNLLKWQFPAGTVLAGGAFLTVWADGEAGETTAGELHTSFRLNASSGSVALSRIVNGQPAVIDYLDYTLLGAGRSYGSHPDAQPQRRRIFHFPTHNAPNNPASIQVSVFINEWLAGNTRIADPADGDFDDWIELYNAGTNAVDLSGYSLTDALTNATKYVIPSGKIVPAKGYLLVWADEETGQNAFGADVHAGFKLAGSGEQIGLFAPDGSLVDSVTFGAQIDDVSEGRASDGEAPPFVTFTAPSPRAANVVASGNRPPVLAAIGNKNAAEGQALSFQVSATDPNAGQTITFALADEPAGATIDPATGIFTWAPGEPHGPGSYTLTIRAIDNGTPPRSASETIRIDVSEVNRAPVLAEIANVSINEGAPFALDLSASDPDLPANNLTFSLEPGAPAGLQIDPATGQISWVAQEAQGPGDYSITVRLADNGSPALSATRTFSIRVNEANNAPVLDPILPVTVDEGAVVAITARAIDPDSPAAAITYSLEPPVPAGASIDPASGVVTWPTTELHGPSTNFLTIRATEKTADALSDTRNFTVVVREANQAPIISAIEDLAVADGASVSVRVQARDNDLPAQTLAYELLPGSPSGMTIDPATGAIRWDVPLDFAASTNTVSLKVTDNGPGQLSATESFQVVVRPGVRVAINEVMHSPAAANAQYVELHNASAASAWDLSGWTLNAREMSFTFPASTVLPAGGHIVVAQNRSAFASAYGTAVPVAGEWTGALRADSDTLRLSRGSELVDIVTFSAAQPWPAATGGAALQLADARQDNNRVASWKAEAGYSGPTNLVLIGSTWRFNQSGTDLGAAWRAPSYNDASWGSGAGLLYVEGAALPAPKNTLLTLGPSTFYFRTRFTLPVKPQSAQLVLNLVLDDGAVVYLNGVEIYRIGMDPGAPTYATFANRVVDNAVFEGPFIVPADALVAGENVLAVEVHQVNAGSSDIVMGCSLDLLGGQVANRTPGQANSVRTTLPAFEPIFINELLAVNANGLADSAGEREPWVELYNAGTAPVSLQGFYLTDSYAALNRWAFPAGASLAPGEFKIVWLDGEAAETLGPEWHANFRASGAGQVALARTQNGQPAVIDYIGYSAAIADNSIGSLPNGQLDERSPMPPTPGASNAAPQANRPPRIENIGTATINEGATLVFPIQGSDPDLPGQALTYRLENAPAEATVNPATGSFRWVPSEAQGPGNYAIRAIVTDNGFPPLSATNEFIVRVTEVNAAPALAAVPRQSASVGTALTVQLNAQDADLPAQRLTFSLTQGANLGASIDAAGLFVWKPSSTHANSTNVFQATVTDDGTPARQAAASFEVVVGPAAPPERPVAAARVTGGRCVLSWTAESGRRYRVWAQETLGAAQWQQLGEATAAGTSASFTDETALGARKFYRIEALP